MTHASLVDSLNALGRGAAPILLDAAWKSVLILAPAWSASLVMGRASAAARHLLWSAALLLLIGIPALSALLPDSAFANPLVEGRPIRGLSRLLPGLALPIRTTTAPPITPGSGAAIGVEWPALLLLIWSAGALAGLTPLVLGTICWRARERHGAPASDPRVRRLFQDARRQLSLLCPVRLLIGTERNMPMISGVLTPSVLLPGTALQWSDFRLRVVLLHELGHAKRWDCLIRPLAQVVRAIYWFNPLMWLAAARLRVEQERACDDLVLRAGTSGADYAEQLIEVAAACRPLAFSSVALAMARPSQTEQRVLEILDESRSRRPVGVRHLIVAALAAMTLAVPLACTHSNSPQQTKARSSPTLDPAWHQQAGNQALRVNRAVQMYITHHFGQLPPTLGATLHELVDLEGIDPATAAMTYVLLAPPQRINPPKQPTPQWVDANTTFTYLGRTELPVNEIPRPSQTVIFYQHLDAGPGEQVLLCFLDGHVEWMTRQEADPYIAKSKQKFSGVAER